MFKKFQSDGSIFLNSELIAKVRRSDLEEIRVLVLKNNKVDLRIYVSFPNNPEPKPTKKGIWLSFKDLPEIITTLKKIAEGESASLELGKSEKIQTRVYASMFHDKELVHVRSFYLDKEEFKPGKGISFPRTVSGEIAEGLEKAAAKAAS